MPIYEYECKQCGHRLECIQRFSDAPLTQCPQCGKEGLNKCISLPSFQLKGSGWYATDYGKKDEKPGEGKSPASSEKTKVGSEQKVSDPPVTKASTEASSQTEPSKKTKEES